MSKKNPVVHFEMPYEDRDRMATFYANAFGWNMLKMGEEMGNYVVAHTTDTDEKNMVTTPGTINGGFFPKKPDWPAQYPSVVLAVDDINQKIKEITDNGGTVLGEPMEIPSVGLYVSFLDTEGNRCSLLQPLGM